MKLKSEEHEVLKLFIGWQRLNFFISHLCQLVSCHDVGQAM